MYGAQQGEQGYGYGGDRHPPTVGLRTHGGQMGSQGSYPAGPHVAGPHGGPTAENSHQNDGMDRPKIMLDGDFLPAAFRTMSYEVAKDVCRYISRGDDHGPPPSAPCSIMRSLVDDAIRDKPAMMHKLVRTLNVERREQLQLIRDIADQMFQDEQVNWGRIVSLHAFCGMLAKYCERGFIPDCCDDIGNILADFVINRLGLWIVTHGGWKGFERQFPAVTLWGGSGLWKGLLIIALMMGAMLAFYSSVSFMRGNGEGPRNTRHYAGPPLGGGG